MLIIRSEYNIQVQYTCFLVDSGLTHSCPELCSINLNIMYTILDQIYGQSDFVDFNMETRTQIRFLKGNQLVVQVYILMLAII